MRFYKLTRLLHDRLEPVYDLLEELNVSPTLYAAPWFLTIFASHFPIGFVVRVIGGYMCRQTPLADVFDPRTPSGSHYLGIIYCLETQHELKTASSHVRDFTPSASAR